MQLIEKVFEDLQVSGHKSLQQSVLEMMEKYGFLSKFHRHEEPDEQRNISFDREIKYFVPAQLRVSDPKLWELTPQESDPCALVFKFCDGFVPHGLFPQLVSRLITLCPKLECTSPPKLYCDSARFILGKQSQFDLVLLCSKRCIKLVLKGYNLVTADQVADMAIQVRTLIEYELESLCKQWHWLRNVHYEVCVVCSACTSSDAQCERHKSGSCSDQDCLHFLPISSVTVEAITLFMCREQVGDHSRFTVANLRHWYHHSNPEVRAIFHDLNSISS